MMSFNNESDQGIRQPYIKVPHKLLLLITISLVVGIFFRFANIDKKPYWNDEVFTSLRISGHRATDVFENRVVTSKYLHEKFQSPNPEKKIIDTAKGLAKEEPQLPPLYFIVARWWVQVFGNSVTVTRSLSASISLLAFPCIYWLCLELFESPLVGGIAIALMAVSPVHVLYAQEARPYSLWTVTILLSSAAFLQAVRTRTQLNWIVYALTLGLGLYTQIFTGLVAIGHGIYLAIVERFQLSKTLVTYLLASLAGILIFTPWLVVIATNFSRTPRIRSNHPLLSVAENWILNLNPIFINLDYKFNSRNLILSFIVISLLLYSLYNLYRQGSRKSWLFIITLVGTTGIALILPDLLTLEDGRVSARISQSPRYLIPLYLGLQLSVAHLLATKIVFLSPNKTQQQLWKIITIVLITSGVLSCATIVQANTWWNKYLNVHDLEVANVINRCVKPLVISKQVRAISLSYYLEPKVDLLLTKEEKIRFPNGYQEVFIYVSGSDKEVDENKMQYEIDNFNDYKIELFKAWKTELDPIRTSDAVLWKVEKKTS
jgi:uncharacterized membrane protein